MRFIWLPTQSPYFNLAVEEYLLTQTEDDVFMLWQNANSVIIGRHQNTLAEINQEYVEAHGVTIARRLTGGGAVFHDLGNLNFSFIQNINPKDREIDFVKYLQPIVDALNSLGVPATFKGRNDLVINDKKISGNAMVFYGNRVLEHGTLLFSTVQNDLAQVLKVDPEKFSDKAVKSVRSRVTNISEHLSTSMTVLEFKDYLMNYILKINNLDSIDSLTEDEMRIIKDLSEKKFSTWEWNYGQSPKYALERKIRTLGGSVQAVMNVAGGRIQDIRFYGDFFSRLDPEELASKLVNTPHTEQSIREVLEQNPVDQYFNNTTTEEIMTLLK